MDNLSSPPRLSIGRVVPATCVIVLLHFGQDFLKPLAIAAILSLVIAPLARKLTGTGLGRTAATLVSVFLVALGIVWLSAVLTMQMVAVAADLPQYKAAIDAKLESIKEVTVRPFERLEAELNAMPPQRPDANPTVQRTRADAGSNDAPLPVEIRQPRPSASDMVSRLLSSIWGPVGEAGIVFVLLVFILLEHESLSDRFIRLVGESQLGTTVQALSDAAHGVSRFFLSQFVVNLAFGAVIGLGLWGIGLPHAALWGSMSALLRFIPYLGVLGAAGLIAVFSAAVDPGWSLVLASLGLFATLELLVAHVVEPQVYGHSTGLAPLAVIVSALFWGALWGPVGLLLSTPLTLCLVVMGRHVSALQPLTILLSEAPGLTAGQRFYQRALSGDADAIVRDARLYLRRGSFAKYCDHVLLFGLALGVADRRAGRIDPRQRERIQAAIVSLAESLSTTQPVRRAGRRRSAVSLVNASVGVHLRRMREERLGRWQGSLDVPTGSIVLCIGFDSERDDLLTELLVRALRQDEIDARSLSLSEPQDPSMADKSVLVGTAFLVYPSAESIDHWHTVTTELRAALPGAILVTVKLPLDGSGAAEDLVQGHVDLVLHSYAEAEAFALQGKKAPT